MGISPVARIISARARWKAESLPRIKPFADKSEKKSTKPSIMKAAPKTVSNSFFVGRKRVKFICGLPDVLKPFFTINTATALLINTKPKAETFQLLNREAWETVDKGFQPLLLQRLTTLWF
jgi:hypothetical protein